MGGVKQHFVPQYYLKNFAQNDRIFVYDKVVKNYLSRNPIHVKHVAFKKNFYDIDKKLLQIYVSEEVTSTSFIDDLINTANEQISAPLLNSFVETGEQVFRNPQIKVISLIRTDDLIDFTILQLYRTPKFAFQFAKSIADEVYKQLANNDIDIKKLKAENILKAVHGAFLISAINNSTIWKSQNKKSLLRPEFQIIDELVISHYSQLRNMNKALWISSIEKYFQTSDAPILISTSNSEFNKVALPLTKRCYFMFSQRKEFAQNIYVINKQNSINLDVINESIKRCAERFVYSYTIPT